MNINQDFINKIDAKVPDKNQTAEAVVAYLNTRDIDNPIITAPHILPTFTFTQIATLISSPSMIKLVDYIHFNQVIADIRAMDHAAVGLWATALAAASYMTSEEKDAIIALVSTATDDPNWTEHISWSEQTFGAQVTVADIEACNLGFL